MRKRSKEYTRNSINISLRKANEYIHKILDEWEEDVCPISDKLCEAIMQKDFMDKSSVFYNLLSIYDIIKRNLIFNNIEPNPQNIDRVFNQIVDIDYSCLNDVLSDISNKPVKKEKNKNNKIEVKKEKELIEENNNNKPNLEHLKEDDNSNDDLEKDIINNDFTDSSNTNTNSNSIDKNENISVDNDDKKINNETHIVYNTKNDVIYNKVNDKSNANISNIDEEKKDEMLSSLMFSNSL